MKFLQTQSQSAEMVRLWPQRQPLPLQLQGQPRGSSSRSLTTPNHQGLLGLRIWARPGPGVQVPQSETDTVFPTTGCRSELSEAEAGCLGDSLRTR